MIISYSCFDYLSNPVVIAGIDVTNVIVHWLIKWIHQVHASRYPMREILGFLRIYPKMGSK
jgi:hypothetical protein